MIKGYCKKHQNSECLVIVMYHVSNRFLKKSQNLPLKFGYFHVSVSSSTSMTPSWLLFFVSAEPSRNILWIDRSEPRFENYTGDKIRKTLKNDENYDVFVSFQLNQVQNCSVQIKKMKDGIEVIVPVILVDSIAVVYT